jgi:hypothetical protein
MKVDLPAKTAGELAKEYDDFTINAILDVIRSRNRIGASRYEIHLMVVPLIKQRFNGIRYSEENLENDLDRLLMDGKISVFYQRYRIV